LVSLAELLAAGTSGGSVLLWKWDESKMPAKEGDSNNMDLSATWEFIASTPVTPPAAHLTVSLALSFIFCLANVWSFIVEHGEEPPGSKFQQVGADLE